MEAGSRTSPEMTHHNPPWSRLAPRHLLGHGIKPRRQRGRTHLLKHNCKPNSMIGNTSGSFGDPFGWHLKGKPPKFSRLRRPTLFADMLEYRPYLESKHLFDNPIGRLLERKSPKIFSAPPTNPIGWHTGNADPVWNPLGNPIGNKFQKFLTKK